MPSLDTIAEVARRIAHGEESARAVAERAFSRIDAEDAALGAFLALTRDDALRAADAVDRARAAGEPLGPLAGVPLAIKDALCMAGAPTTAGSRVLQGYRPPYEATVVARLRAAGAVLVGKTNMDEFAMGSTNEHSGYRPCKNPWNPAHVAGGSSGGSAAAVAAGMALGALGSDTGGSIRQPAAYTGTVGIKPTYGRVSRYGLVAFASSLDQVGAFATDVAGAARILAAIAGHDPRDATSANEPLGDPEAACRGALGGLRVGVIEETLGDGLSKGARASFEGALERLRDAGASVTKVSFPALRHAVATYYVLATAEASSNLSRFDGVRYGARVMPSPRASLAEMIGATRDAGFGAEVKRRILLGTFVLSADAFEAYYRKAQKVRRLVRDALLALLRDVDVLVSPTAPGDAPVLGENADDPLAVYLSDAFTLPASLAGLPGMSVPSGLSARGLPLGLQIVGRPFDEATVLRVGARFEERSAFREAERPT